MPSQLDSASTFVDSPLFRDAFGTAAMRAAFSDRQMVQRYIDVEVALAHAEARCGGIPAAAAQAIAHEPWLDRPQQAGLRQLLADPGGDRAPDGGAGGAGRLTALRTVARPLRCWPV